MRFRSASAFSSCGARAGDAPRRHATRSRSSSCSAAAKPTLESVVDAPISRCSARRRSTCSRSAPTASRSRDGDATSTTSSPTGRGRWTSRSTGHRASSGTAPAPTASSPSCRSTRPTAPTLRISSRRTSRPGASRGCCRRRRSGAGRARATSAARCSSRWSIRRRRRSAATCASSSVQVLCTNRDLCCRCRSASARPTCRSTSPRRWRASASSAARAGRHAPLADGAVAWRAISHLSLNYLSLVNSTPQEGAAALRELLELYAPSARRQRAEADRGHRGRCACAPVVRRLPRAGPLAFGRGLEITSTVDELAFEGASAFLLGRRARPLLRALRVDQFVHRNRAAVREPGRDQPMGAAWGARPTL